EPALGPVTYIHRESASENPAAPLSHHLQDSTHTSFGVVTTGFVIDRFKIEGSAFNGHEPDEDRWDIQLGARNSWSFRVSPAPTHRSFRSGACAVGGVRDLVRNHHSQRGLGADMVLYSKPGVLDSTDGDRPVSFPVFFRLPPGLSGHRHSMRRTVAVCGTAEL